MKEKEYLRFRRRPGTEVVAVRLDLDTDGFTYTRWGGIQKCKRGDWIVLENGKTRTVDAESFAQTYEKVGPGLFNRVGDVWAKMADASGSIDTKEGTTHFKQGDYIVCNNVSKTDCWAIPAKEFGRLYELVK